MSKFDFETLNNALTTQLERLMSADGETVEYEIKRSNAVSQLASNINTNMSNAVRVARLLAEDGEDVRGLKATMPMLMGGDDDPRE